MKYRVMSLVPNCLTSTRFILTPLYFFPIPEKGALAVLILAIVTDLLDGPLARKLNAVSFVGQFFDHLTDRFHGVACGIYLLKHGLINPYLLGVILAFEALRIALLAPKVKKGVEVEARWPGKLQIFGYGLAFVLTLAGVLPRISMNVMLIVSLLLGIYALLKYYLPDKGDEHKLRAAMYAEVNKLVWWLYLIPAGLLVWMTLVAPDHGYYVGFGIAWMVWVVLVFLYGNYAIYIAFLAVYPPAQTLSKRQAFQLMNQKLVTS